MKLGIIIDSSAGISKKEADKRKWGFLPLYITIDNKEYADGIDITKEKYFSNINLESEVRTSATPPGVATEILEEFSKKNDFVLVYTLSSELSSQNNNLAMLAKEFDNVFVVPSKGVGYAITKDCERLEELAKKGESIEKLKESAIEYTEAQYGIAAPKSMKWLVKGGRVSSAAAAMASLMKIVPLIRFEKGKLDKHGKGRVFRKSILKMAKELYEKFGDTKEYLFYHGNNDDTNEIKKEVEEILGTKIESSYFPPVIVNHIGPEVIAIITREK